MAQGGDSTELSELIPDDTSYCNSVACVLQQRRRPLLPPATSGCAGPQAGCALSEGDIHHIAVRNVLHQFIPPTSVPRLLG